MYSRRIEFRRNRFLHNRGFASVGLLFKACDDTLAEDNLLADNARGIFLEGSYRNVFRRNVVAESDAAIVLYDSCGGVRFEGNSFVGNLTPLDLVGRRTDTRFDGNYWSDNDEPDLDGDGRSDRPVRPREPLRPPAREPLRRRPARAERRRRGARRGGAELPGARADRRRWTTPRSSARRRCPTCRARERRSAPPRRGRARRLRRGGSRSGSRSSPPARGRRARGRAAVIRFESLTKRFGEPARGRGPDARGRAPARWWRSSARTAPARPPRSRRRRGSSPPTAGRVLAGEPGHEHAGARGAAPRLLPAAAGGLPGVAHRRRDRGVLPPRCAARPPRRGAARCSASRRLNGAAGRAGRRPTPAAWSSGSASRWRRCPDARVFLLDEPTSSLDPDGLCAFYGLVERWRREGRAVLFSSHQLGDVERLADRVAVLVDGRLVADLGAAGARGAGSPRAGSCASASTPARPGWSRGSPRSRRGRAGRGDELIVPGAPALRAAALDAVRAAGAEIRGLTAEEGRLDALYRELVEGAA